MRRFVFMVALAGAAGLGGAMPFDGDDDAALLAAQLEILVLRASLPASANQGLDTVVLAGQSRALTSDEAATLIALLPKPLRCTGTANASGVLAIQCGPIDSDDAAGSLEDARYVFNLGLGSDRVSGGDASVLLVRSPEGDGLRLSLAAFRRWYHEYVAPPDLAFGDRPPTAQERAEGVDHVVEVYRVDHTIPDDVPPEVRRRFE